MFDLQMQELPSKPMVSEFVVVENGTVVLNPKGLACQSINNINVARIYLRAAARFICGWYETVRTGWHTFQPATGPYWPQVGCYMKDGEWYFLDSAGGKYVRTSNKMPDTRSQAHTVNDSLLTYRIEIPNIYTPETWEALTKPLTTVINAEDRTAAKAALNTLIRSSSDRKKERRELITAVQNGAEADVASIVVGGVDIMTFHTGSVLIDGKPRKWSAKNAFAVNAVRLAISKGQSVEFTPEDAVLVAG